MMETRTRGKGTIDHGLQGSVGTLADANSTRLSKRSQAVPLQLHVNLQQDQRTHNLPTAEEIAIITPEEYSDKENSIELDFLYYLYNYYMVCALFSHTHHVIYYVI